MFDFTKEEIDTYIKESNAIENIFEPANHPLVVNHKKAVKFALKMARRGVVADPLIIHGMLMESEWNKRPGQYRNIRVTIGRNTTPWPNCILELMADLMNTLRDGPKNKEDIEQWIWNMHYEFECIHPFIDGNGRTGRIWMNAIRIIYGLPWLTIFEKEKYEYFRRIDIYRWESPHYQQYSAEDPACNVETLC